MTMNEALRKRHIDIFLMDTLRAKDHTQDWTGCLVIVKDHCCCFRKLADDSWWNLDSFSNVPLLETDIVKSMQSHTQKVYWKL